MVLEMGLNKENTGADTCSEDESDSQIHASPNESSQEFPNMSAVVDNIVATPSSSRRSSYHLESKVDMVCGLLSMLRNEEHADIGETLLNLSTTSENCLAMRQSGCVPLLVKIMQLDENSDTRHKAAKAVYNIISSRPEERIRNLEIKVFKLLNIIRRYKEQLCKGTHDCRHPLDACLLLRKSSLVEDYRQVICYFGGIHELANLIEAEHIHHGGTPDAPACNSLRKYVCMTVTNVTFSDSGNKALLCSYRRFMRAIVVQLQSSSEELRKVSATILRNLAWHPDTASKDMLREVGAVAGLVKAAMVTTGVATMRCILSALWNLSAHSTENKAEICAIEGALAFLVDKLSHQIKIAVAAGGVLRNISSQISVRDDYREVLRQQNCVGVLVEHLKSTNEKIVINACGVIWNLSAKCATDQDALIRAGALDLLSPLTNSTHEKISLSASSAIRNLLHSAQQRSHGDNIIALIIHKHQDFVITNVEGPTICDESLYFENICEYIPLSGYNKNYLSRNSVSIESPPRNGSGDGQDVQLFRSFKSLNISSDSTVEHSKAIFPPTAAPKLKTSSPSAFVSVRNNFPEPPYEDEAASSEHPIDYGRKYAEIKIGGAQCEQGAKSFYYSKSAKEHKTSGIYAETDLDQPIDYALQYAEDDSDSGSDKVQDTVKTYCTEDTPYVTPFNFSNATSMSDIRVEPKETATKTNDTEHDVPDSPSVRFEDDVGILEAPPATVEAPYSSDIACAEKPVTYSDEGPSSSSDAYLQMKPTAEIVKSSYSSGITSPEKPINYCDEGTPGYFSRVSSYSSLNNEDFKEKDKLEEVEVKRTESGAVEGSTRIANSADAKVVKFDITLEYAEETPLMFSRSSSVGSFDSNEQRLINEDNNSVVSDFSRRTSGVVSPSELPDSPTQMLSPTQKTAFARTDTSQDESCSFRPASTVFDDKFTKYKDEHTPVQFSYATSLSSLTIDDEAKSHSGEYERPEEKQQAEEAPDDSFSSQGERGEVKHEVSKELGDELLEIEEENEDEILAACIKMGMPSKRAQKQEKTTALQSDVQANLTPTVAEENPESSAEGNLSEDDDKLLAECIEAGKNKTVVQKVATGSSTYVTLGYRPRSPERNEDSGSGDEDLEEESDSEENERGANATSTHIQPDVRSSISRCSNEPLVARLARRQRYTSEQIESLCTRCRNYTASPSVQDSIQNDIQPKRYLLTAKGFSRQNSSDQSRSSSEPHLNGSKPIADRQLDTGRVTLITAKGNGTVSPSGGICGVFTPRPSSVISAIPSKAPPITDFETLRALVTQSRSFFPPDGVVSDPRSIHPAMGPSDLVRSPTIHNKDIAKGKGVLGLHKVLTSVKDEAEKYATENSPSHYSWRSSLSDLTVDGSVAGIVSHVTSGIVSPHPEPLTEEASTSYACAGGTYEQKTDKYKDEQSTEKKVTTRRLSIGFLSEEDDDDDILAVCIQMGMRSRSLYKQTNPGARKQRSEITSNSAGPSNVNGGRCISPEPLVGRLEAGLANKLSFKLKETLPRESTGSNDTLKESKTAPKLPSREKPHTVTGQPNSLPDYSSNGLLRQESLSEEPSAAQPVSSFQIAESGQVAQSTSPKSAKRTKKSKSRRVLVEKMGKVVDLLKLRKN